MSLETEYHTALTNRVAEWAQLRGARPHQNFRLPDGKYADLLWMDKDGIVTIVEIKTYCVPSLVETAFRKYQHYCHRLYIAAPPIDVASLLKVAGVLRWPRSGYKLGYLSITERGVQVSQEAETRPMPERLTQYLGWQLKERDHWETRPYPDPANSPAQ